jgi:hypothetical protein
MAMARSLRTTRFAVAAVFFANGAGFASWVPHIPMVQLQLDLRPSVLGLALLAMAAGALVGIPLSGRAAARFGSRPVVRASAALFFAALLLPLLAPTLPALVGALLLLGAGNGALDVSMNAQALAVEHRWPRPIMSSFHGMWSAGGVVGAGLAALALGLGMAPALHVALAAAGFGGVAAVAATALLPPVADVRNEERRFAQPGAALLGLGAIAFSALFAEGAMGDWSAVYLHHSLGTSGGTAALGFAAVSFTMMTGRFLGDALVARFGSERLVQVTTGGSAVAFGAALLVAEPAVALVGFACVGAGLANLVPIVFRAAGALPGVAASEGIAAVGTAGYVGFLAGPPLIGLAAEAVTLPGALGLVVVALGWIALSAAHVRAS